MAGPSDESLPLEFSESSTKRRAPKKLQNIGIGQFKRPGVAHHLQPGSAAAIFNKQKAEQQTEAWLRRAPTNAPQDGAKGKGKRKAKKGAKSRKDEATSTTTKDADDESFSGDLSTRPVVAVAQMGRGKSATENGKTQDQTQGDARKAVKARTRKVIKVVTVDRRVKATQGAWGQRAVENAKHAAAKAITTSYSTTPITIDAADGELSATVMPTPKPPTPEPIIPRAAAVKPKSVSTKTVRKPATKSRVPKKFQAPMWSDSDSENDDQDQDDIYDLLLSSRTAGSTMKTTRGRTTKNSSLRNKPARDQPKPQKKRQVRFAPTTSPEDEEEEEEEGEGEEADKGATSSNTTADQTRNPKPTSRKQQTNQQPPMPYSTLDLPQANFHISSQAQTKQTTSPSPAELADDEDSYVLSPEKEAPIAKNKSKAPPTTSPWPAFTPNPFSASAKKRAQDKEQEQEQDRPPRRKGVAHPPQPKRARATTTTDDDDDDEANDSAAPVSKKAKTSGEKTKSTTKKKQDLPARKKKGVATKIKAKRARAVVRYESDIDDDDDE